MRSGLNGRMRHHCYSSISGRFRLIRACPARTVSASAASIRRKPLFGRRRLRGGGRRLRRDLVIAGLGLRFPMLLGCRLAGRPILRTDDDTLAMGAGGSGGPCRCASEHKEGNDRRNDGFQSTVHGYLSSAPELSCKIYMKISKPHLWRYAGSRGKSCFRTFSR